MHARKCDTRACINVVDVEEYPECLDSEGQVSCLDCVAAHEAEGRALAAEHGRDRQAARHSLQDIQGIKDAGRGHLLDGKGVQCPRCKQVMPDMDAAGGCEDRACPFIGGER